MTDELPEHVKRAMAQPGASQNPGDYKDRPAPSVHATDIGVRTGRRVAPWDPFNWDSHPNDRWDPFSKKLRADSEERRRG